MFQQSRHFNILLNGNIFCKVCGWLLLVALLPGHQSALSAQQTPDSPSTLLTWSQVNTDSFGLSGSNTAWGLTACHNELYAGTRNAQGAMVYERNGDTTAWTNRSPLSWLSDPSNTAVPVLLCENFPLYAGTQNAAGSQVWYFDGTDWTYWNIDGFDDSDNTAVSTLAKWGEDLIAGTANSVDGAGIFLRQLSTGIWTQINSPGFGDYHNDNAVSMAVYSPLGLVVGTWNWNGAQVWAYDGADWGSLATNGFGHPHNAGARSMAVFNDQLYVGTWNATDGAEVYRYIPPATWLKVRSGGFGDANNIGVSVLYPFAGYLYAGTENNASGAQIWRSGDGSVWEQVMGGGFGDANNTEVPSLTSLSHRLFAGTRNYATGAEVWRTLPLGESTSFQVSTITADSTDAAHPDLAYDPNHDQYLAAWTEYESRLTVRTKARVFTPNGQMVSPVIDLGDPQSSQPQAAFDTDLGDRYLVAWNEYDIDTGNVRLKAQFLNANGSKIGGVLLLRSGPGYQLEGMVFSPVSKSYVLLYSLHETPPYFVYGLDIMTVSQAGVVTHEDIVVRQADLNKEIIGSDLAWNHAHNEVLVVWSQWEGAGTNRISGRRVELATYDVLGPSFVISGDHAGYEDTYPSVAAMGGEPPGVGTYMVVWESLKENPGYLDTLFVAGRKVDGDGNLMGPSFAITSPPAAQACPQVAGNEASRGFFVSYQTDYRYYPHIPYPFAFGKFLQSYGGAVSTEYWVGGGDFTSGNSVCASLVGGDEGEFMLAKVSSEQNSFIRQIWATRIRFKYLQFLGVIFTH